MKNIVHIIIGIAIFIAGSLSFYSVFAESRSTDFILEFGNPTMAGGEANSQNYILQTTVFPISNLSYSSDFQVSSIKHVKTNCGNGIQELGEECDPPDFGGRTCQTYNFGKGTLTCIECFVDISHCSEPIGVGTLIPESRAYSGGSGRGGGGIGGMPYTQQQLEEKKQAQEQKSTKTSSPEEGGKTGTGGSKETKTRTGTAPETEESTGSEKQESGTATPEQPAEQKSQINKDMPAGEAGLSKVEAGLGVRELIKTGPDGMEEQLKGYGVLKDGEQAGYGILKESQNNENNGTSPLLWVFISLIAIFSAFLIWRFIKK